MNEKINNLCKLTYFSLTDITFNIFHGAPFFLRKEITWKNIRVPPFPVFLSILSGILFYFPVFIKASRMEASRIGSQAPLSLVNLIIAFLISCVIGTLSIFLLNFINLFWYRHIIKKIKKTQHFNSKDYIFGSQRILYFSAFYQLLLFVVFVSVDEISFYFPYDTKYIYTAVIIILIGSVRLSSVFQGMLREVNGSKISALISIFPCFDVWFMYIWIFAYFSGI